MDLKIQPLGSSSGLCFAASPGKGMQLSLSPWGSQFGKPKNEQHTKNLSAKNDGAHFFLPVYFLNRK